LTLNHADDQLHHPIQVIRIARLVNGTELEEHILGKPTSFILPQVIRKWLSWRRNGLGQESIRCWLSAGVRLLYITAENMEGSLCTTTVSSHSNALPHKIWHIVKVFLIRPCNERQPGVMQTLVPNTFILGRGHDECRGSMMSWMCVILVRECEGGNNSPIS
jgi:hypothetical protein